MQAKRTVEYVINKEKAVESFVLYLRQHESDIQNDIDDYGDLKEIFVEFMGRKPGSVINIKAIKRLTVHGST